MNYFLATATTFPESYFSYGRSIGLGVPCLTANSEPLVTVSCHTAPRIPSGGGSGMECELPRPLLVMTMPMQQLPQVRLFQQLVPPGPDDVE